MSPIQARTPWILEGDPKPKVAHGRADSHSVCLSQLVGASADGAAPLACTDGRLRRGHHLKLGDSLDVNTGDVGGQLHGGASSG